MGPAARKMGPGATKIGNWVDPVREKKRTVLGPRPRKMGPGWTGDRCRENPAPRCVVVLYRDSTRSALWKFAEFAIS